MVTSIYAVEFVAKMAYCAVVSCVNSLKFVKLGEQTQVILGMDFASSKTSKSMSSAQVSKKYGKQKNTCIFMVPIESMYGIFTY